jgi:hypothetical protein
MEALEGEEVLLLLILDLGTRWGLSGQHHAPAALLPRGKDPRYPLYRRLGGPQSQSGKRIQGKSFRLCRGSNLDRPVVQRVARLTELPGSPFTRIKLLIIVYNCKQFSNVVVILL